MVGRSSSAPPDGIERSIDPEHRNDALRIAPSEPRPHEERANPFVEILGGFVDGRSFHGQDHAAVQDLSWRLPNGTGRGTGHCRSPRSRTLHR